QFLEQAVARDPNYALAWSGLADAYSSFTTYGGDQTEYYAKANAAARKALALDPTMGHPHAVLGSDYVERDWDFAGGEAEYEKALSLEPNDATARQWYAEDMVFFGGARAEKAIANIDRAHQLDPASVIIDVERGYVRTMSRDFDEGLAIAKQAVAEHPDFPRAHLNLALAYWSKKMYAESVAAYKGYAKVSGDAGDAAVAQALDEGYRQGGWKAGMKKVAAVMMARRESGDPFFPIAAAFAEAGDKEAAFQSLETGYRERDRVMQQLKTDFEFDALRDDPRFDSTMKKVGLP